MEHKSTAKIVKVNTFHSMLSSLGINSSRRLLSQIWKIFKGLNNFVSNNKNMNVKVIYCYASEGKLIAAGVKKISSSLLSFWHNQRSSLRAFLQSPPSTRYWSLLKAAKMQDSRNEEEYQICLIHFNKSYVPSHHLYLNIFYLQHGRRLLAVFTISMDAT